jgi:hypothetical protein
MCEPTHSVVQYPAFTEAGDPVESYLQAAFMRSLSRGRRVGEMMHYSMAGFGHSECISKIPAADAMLPEPTRYEGLWWKREFKIDGPFNGPFKDEASMKEAFAAAEKYSKLLSYGDVYTLQQFVRDAIQNSSNPQRYVDIVLQDVLRGGFRAVAYDTIREALQGDTPNSRYAVTPGLRESNKKVFDKLQTTVTGILSRRENFNEIWADDDSLWTSSGEPVMQVQSTPMRGKY